MANLVIELEKSKGDWNQASLKMLETKNDLDPVQEKVRTVCTKNAAGGLTIEVHNELPYDLSVKPKEVLTVHIPREAILDIFVELKY